MIHFLQPTEKYLEVFVLCTAVLGRRAVLCELPGLRFVWHGPTRFDLEVGKAKHASVVEQQRDDTAVSYDAPEWFKIKELKLFQVTRPNQGGLTQPLSNALKVLARLPRGRPASSRPHPPTPFLVWGARQKPCL